MGRACSTNGEKRNLYRVLVENLEGQRLLRRRGWVVNIKMYLKEVGWGGMDCNDLAQDRNQWRALVNMEMNFRVL
jgi:hypothetical protein